MMVMAESSKCKTDGVKPAVFERLALMEAVGPSRDNADLSYVDGNGNDNISLKCGLDWIGLDWIGLDWIGLDWIGLDWIGLDWIGNCDFVQRHHTPKKV